jgi:predicted secreted hydrolase
MRGALTGWLPVVAGLGIGAAMAAAPVLPPAASAPDPARFAQAVTPRSFLFPRDHGPHESFRQEWWYLTGNLDGAGGQRLGFELTFFRFALQPPAAAAEPAAQSAWRTRQIYMAHFAITDVAAQRFSFAQKLSRAALGLAGAQGEPLRVWIDDWSLQGAMANAATIRADGSWSVHAAQEGYELELTLQALAAPVLNGEAGLSRKSSVPADASYYYSIPRLAARGVLTRDGRALPVQGLAWFDREWGSAELNARQAGWDWFALQLQDGTALMFYALRGPDGARDAHSAGTWIGPHGETRALKSGDVLLEVTGHWLGADRVRYPSGWRLRVPSLSLEVAVQPVLADQELRGTPRYWEGAVDVDGTRAGERLGGRGYVELVGYPQER